MKTIGYVRKKASDEIGSSPWGVQYTASILGADDNYPEDRLCDLTRACGIKWARFSRRWPQVEVQKGRFDWSIHDRTVEGLTSHGVNLFLGTGCVSHRAYMDFPEGYYYPPTPSPAALEGFCRYTSNMVERYGDRVRHYEVWNEPNHERYWRPAPEPEAYALLVRRASQAMRAVKSDIKVLGGVLAGVGPTQTQYAHDFLSQPGTAEAMDILTYHPYNPAPEATWEDIVALRDTVRAIKPELPIWQGECGCPSSGDTIHFRGDAPWGYNVQSKWLLRRLLADYMCGAEISVYFLIVEFHGNLVNGDPTSRWAYNTKGLIQHTTWQPKPAYYTMGNLTATIDHSWKPVQDKAEIEILDPGVFFGIGPHEDRFPCVPWQFAMRREDTHMLAYWLPWRPQEIVRPATVRISWPSVSWREPVWVDLLSGEVSEARRVGGDVEAPMADYPMLLSERDSLDLAEAPQQPSYEELVAKLRWTY